MSAQRREKPDWIADPCESQHTLSPQSRDNRFIRYERGAQHEAAARIGAARLPFRSRWAVLSAARIYGAIGREVQRRGTAAWDYRVSTSTWDKIRHAAAAFVEALVNRPPSLAEMPRWTRRDFTARA